MHKLALLALFGAMAGLKKASAAHVVTVTAPATTLTVSATGSYSRASQWIASHPSASASISSYRAAAPSAQASVSAAAMSVSSYVASNPSVVSNASASIASAVSSAAPTASAGSVPSNINVSFDEFMTAWTNGKQYLPDANIQQPTQAQYNAFITEAGPSGGITSRMELAMFLSEIMWESGGLIYKAELQCAQNNCSGQYVDNVGLPGQYYYGRGYIQLTWGANYKNASMDLYNDDRLLQNPDQVATDEDTAWAVSFHYWKYFVKPTLGTTNQFGLATKAINGALECGSGPNVSIAQKVFDPSQTPNPAGCYS
jgi:predicted chitinase